MNYKQDSHLESVVLAATGASSMEVAGVIQDLWSGYGKILRVRLMGCETKTAVVKHVRLPEGGVHPRGWNTNLSRERKVRSYQIETAWYRDWGGRCDGNCRIPEFLAYDQPGNELLLVLEDLDSSGYPARLTRVMRRHMEICLQWLAWFHASFMGENPRGLWTTGTYWHLATRGEELAALKDSMLKKAAEKIDRRLNQANHQTLVHGDAKLANFCFSHSGDRVAAVDFQYVGGGCGMKDVAYFIGSCLDEKSCEEQESTLLDCYFNALRTALAEKKPELDALSIESEWRALFPVAWTDFHRFLKGWSPGHWKINSYSEKLARQVLADL